MSEEIHGALVGGLLGGAAVVVGIVGAEWLVRRREGHREIVEAVMHISFLLTYVLGPISDAWPNDKPFDTSMGSEWWQKYVELRRGLVKIISNQGFPITLKRSKQTEDTLIRVDAAVQLWLTERSRVTSEELGAVIAGAPTPGLRGDSLFRLVAAEMRKLREKRR